MLQVQQQQQEEEVLASPKIIIIINFISSCTSLVGLPPHL
jgi:hypothetical protein